MPEPPFALVDPATRRVDLGVMAGGTGARQSRIRDLGGAFADEPAFAMLVAERGDDTAYAVDEFRPARANGMRTLIVEIGDGWRQAGNPRYQPCSEAEQHRYFEAA